MHDKVRDASKCYWALLDSNHLRIPREKRRFAVIALQNPPVLSEHAPTPTIDSVQALAATLRALSPEDRAGLVVNITDDAGEQPLRNDQPQT